MPNYSKNPYSVAVSNEGLIKVNPGDSLSKYSWAIYGNYTTLDQFARPGSNGQPAKIANVNLIYAGETLIHLRDYKRKSPGSNGQVGIGSPVGGSAPVSIGASSEVAPSISLLSINRTGIDLGGWKFDVKVNGALSEKQSLILTFGPSQDFLFGTELNRSQLECLLELFAYSNLWGQTLQCKALVVERVPWSPSEPRPDDVRLRRTFSPSSRYPFVYAFRILSESAPRNIQVPVPPIPTCPWGRDMLLRIGQIQPRLPFIMDTAGNFAGSWLTQPIGGRNYLKRGFQDGGQLVTEQAWNGMDCTTYMLAGFGLDISVAGLYADEIVDSLPLQLLGEAGEGKNGIGIGGTTEVHDFFQTHPGGNYVAFHKWHFVAVIDGIVREFSRANGGYVETPVLQKSFPTGSPTAPGETSNWSVRQF